jgi:hypothetical protein
MDFYFLTSLINMLWQIFTILFVLYRFTSFFSMMYNFMLFLGKLLKGAVYIKDQISIYIARKRGYSYLSNDEINGLPNGRPTNSWFTKIKEWIFGKQRRPHIPLYETRHSYTNLGMSSEFHGRREREEITSPRSSRPDIEFENHMNNMLNSNYESSEFYTNRNLKSSFYPPPPPQHRRTQSQPSIISITVNESRENHESRESRESRESHGPSPQPSKPFNVSDSNMLFNSQFLTKMLNPFSSEEIEKDDNKDDELEKALLNSDYDNV